MHPWHAQTAKPAQPGSKTPENADIPSLRTNQQPLPVGLGNTLQLILLLDRVAVAASLGSVDQLFGQALGDGLDVAEGGLTGTDGEESNGLVDTAERGDIDGLTTDGTGGTDTGAVFAGTAVDDGIDGDLNGVLVGHDVDLLRVRRVLSHAVMI
jgi:hypothetical protein